MCVLPFYCYKCIGVLIALKSNLKKGRQKEINIFICPKPVPFTVLDVQYTVIFITIVIIHIKISYKNKIKTKTT